MSNMSSAWPALEHLRDLKPVKYEQAIWGKVLGSADDFGWIAHTAGFRSGDPTPVDERLHLGSEDRYAPSFLWKRFGEYGFAIRTYESRVVDTTRLRGMEKHFVSWLRPPIRRQPTPMAAAAAALLIEAARLGQIADVHGAAASGDPGALSLEAGLVDLQSAVDAVIKHGIRQLLETIDSKASLVDCYSNLLARVRPAVLRASAPLPAAAVAALLLPLEHNLADAVSIAGWIPSTRYKREALAAEWDLVVCEASAPQFADVQPVREHQAKAEALVALLYAPPRPQASQRSQPSQAAAPAGAVAQAAWQGRSDVQVLIDFARSKDRSLPAAGPPRQARVTDDEKLELMSSLDEIKSELYADNLDNDALDARRRHLQHKANQIRTRAIAIDPDLDALDWKIE